MIVKVLGPGCRNCSNLERATRQAIDDLGLDATVEKVTDYPTIVGYGVMATPGLVVHEVLVCSGRVPTAAEVRKLLTAVTAGPTGNAPASASTRVVASHDPDAAFLTGFPGERISHTNTGGQGTDDPAAGVLTGFPGDRTPSHLGAGAESADPDAEFLTGFPGERISHTNTGGQGTDDPAAGVLTGFPGHRTPSHLGTDTTN